MKTFFGIIIAIPLMLGWIVILLISALVVKAISREGEECEQNLDKVWLKLIGNSPQLLWMD